MMLFWTLWLPVIYPLFPRRNTDEEPHELAWRQLFMRAAFFAALSYLDQRCAGRAGLQAALDDAGSVRAADLAVAHVKRGGDFPVAIRAFGALVIAFICSSSAGGSLRLRWRSRLPRGWLPALRPSSPNGRLS
jgi:hypothetical protein